MKKIGILFGMEQSFPQAVADYINTKKVRSITADIMKIGAITTDDMLDYSVIFDRVSCEVPFYQSALRIAALGGTHIINNPFVACTDDNFTHAAMANKIGINIPKTAVIPSKMHPTGTTSETMRNLIYPLEWDTLFNYIGFPANLKANKGSGSYHSFRVYNPQEFFSAYDLTGDRVMMLQQTFDYEDYYRCFVIGRQHAKIMKYDPTMPQHMRYSGEAPSISSALQEDLIKTSLKICSSLGTDFNAVEFGIFEGKPYTVDFLNQLPDAERAFLSDENFDWLVKTTSEFLVNLALKGKNKYEELSLGAFLQGPKLAAVAEQKRGRGRPKKVETPKKKASKPKIAKPKIVRERSYPGKEF